MNGSSWKVPLCFTGWCRNNSCYRKVSPMSPASWAKRHLLKWWSQGKSNCPSLPQQSDFSSGCCFSLSLPPALRSGNHWLILLCKPLLWTTLVERHYISTLFLIISLNTLPGKYLCSPVTCWGLAVIGFMAPWVQIKGSQLNWSFINHGQQGVASLVYEIWVSFIRPANIF